MNIFKVESGIFYKSVNLEPYGISTCSFLYQAAGTVVFRKTATCRQKTDALVVKNGFENVKKCLFVPLCYIVQHRGGSF